jgi:hypothetical protein
MRGNFSVHFLCLLPAEIFSSESLPMKENKVKLVAPFGIPAKAWEGLRKNYSHFHVIKEDNTCQKHTIQA